MAQEHRRLVDKSWIYGRTKLNQREGEVQAERHWEQGGANMTVRCGGEIRLVVHRNTGGKQNTGNTG